ncbi:aminotransferase class IV [Fertoeibacter niger]|uniref:aminotransferase class IV n=1 Tax=Fertoeibacter niger TaxID=2656921 RepID=UPI003B97A862
MESALRGGGGEPGLRLIETLLWDGAAFPRLAGHVARLERSARLLGWPCADPGPTLRAAAPSGPARLRLTLDAEGALEVTVAALPAALALWRVGLAGASLNSADPWLGLKTTRRAAYDAARAALPPGLDEVVFLNERGEVCDGTITTLFFDLGTGLCTPPLASGLLPGVLRADMLSSGMAREAVLQGRDLPRARLWLGNALRGLAPAIWAG